MEMGNTLATHGSIFSQTINVHIFCPNRQSRFTQFSLLMFRKNMSVSRNEKNMQIATCNKADAKESRKKPNIFESNICIKTKQFISSVYTKVWDIFLRVRSLRLIHIMQYWPLTKNQMRPIQFHNRYNENKNIIMTVFHRIKHCIIINHIKVKYVLSIQKYTAIELYFFLFFQYKFGADLQPDRSSFRYNIKRLYKIIIGTFYS